MSDVRILLVEDNPDDELLTLRALKKGNFVNPVTVARDGAEALEFLIGSRAMPFGLVLLDLRLPKIHGLEVLQRLRADERTKLTRVVILTSSAEGPDIKSGYSVRRQRLCPETCRFPGFRRNCCAARHVLADDQSVPPEAQFADCPPTQFRRELSLRFGR